MAVGIAYEVTDAVLENSANHLVVTIDLHEVWQQLSSHYGFFVKLELTIPVIKSAGNQTISILMYRSLLVSELSPAQKQVKLQYDLKETFDTTREAVGTVELLMYDKAAFEN